MTPQPRPAVGAPGAAHAGESRLFAPDDLVLPAHPKGPRFGELRWDLAGLGLAANQARTTAVLDFARYLTAPPIPDAPNDSPSLAPAWLLRAKEVVAILVSPVRSTGHGSIDLPQVRAVTAPSTLRAVHAHLYALATWATAETLPPELHRWDQDDLDEFLHHLHTQRTNGRGGHGLDPASTRPYLTTLRTLHRLHEVLTEGGFTFEPWSGMNTDAVTGAEAARTSRTPPIPPEQYQPLMRNLWTVIDQIAPDVVAARQHAQTLTDAPRQLRWNQLRHTSSPPRESTETPPAGAGRGAPITEPVVLVHGNAGPHLHALRRVLTEQPEVILAGSADLQRRFGISASWFTQTREDLLEAGILERVHLPTAVRPRCAVPECTRERRRHGWCRRHEDQWRSAGQPDPETWQHSAALGEQFDAAPACAAATCPHEARHGRWCDPHRRRWVAAGRPDPAAWSSSDDAAAPVGRLHYRPTGWFPEVRTVAEHLTAWLENPEHRIPLRATGPLAAHLKTVRGACYAGDPVQRDLLADKLRLHHDALRDPAVRAVIDTAVTRGQTEVGGLAEISTIRWADGRSAPWIDGIDPALLEPLTHLCRMSAVLFIYLFSGMRDSEVQSLRKGCVEEFWGHLTLTGNEFKTFRGGQARWVVIEPVARAARLAEALTWHHERIVVPAPDHSSNPVPNIATEIDGLIATMNTAAELGLLEPIPDGAPIRPHRFRRTFAVTARTHPWMQIALHWQFKHASHYMTQSYYALNDDVTDDNNEVARELVEAAVDRLAELYEKRRHGQPLYGKAAPRLAVEIDTIAADIADPANNSTEKTSGGDGFVGESWRHTEIRKRLRGTSLRLYPGLALDCAFGPGGACGGVEAPNWNACTPLCRNAILDPTQLAFLHDTARRIRSYLADPLITDTNRLLLQAQLDELTTAITEHEAHPANPSSAQS